MSVKIIQMKQWINMDREVPVSRFSTKRRYKALRRMMSKMTMMTRTIVLKYPGLHETVLRSGDNVSANDIKQLLNMDGGTPGNQILSQE